MKPQDQSKSEHIFSLAQELLDDIELSKLSAEALLLKATRLARLAGSEKIQHWLSYEMGGYNAQDKISLEFMGRTGRWIKYEKKEGYWGPLAQQEATIQALKSELQSLRLPDLSGEWVAVATRQIMNRAATISAQISKVSGGRCETKHRSLLYCPNLTTAIKVIQASEKRDAIQQYRYSHTNDRGIG
jgi:hypothetical protein